MMGSANCRFSNLRKTHPACAIREGSVGDLTCKGMPVEKFHLPQWLGQKGLLGLRKTSNFEDKAIGR